MRRLIAKAGLDIMAVAVDTAAQRVDVAVFILPCFAFELRASRATIWPLAGGRITEYGAAAHIDCTRWHPPALRSLALDSHWPCGSHCCFLRFVTRCQFFTMSLPMARPMPSADAAAPSGASLQSAIA